jgi:hypothetical protein
MSFCVCRYSVQMNLICKKYYKTLFYGLLDMAIVNALIVHRVYAEKIRAKPLSHADFIVQLHEELLLLKTEDFTDANNVHDDEPTRREPTPRGPTVYVTSHKFGVSTDKTPSGHTKSRVCKVCSIYNQAQEAEERTGANTTRYFCVDCSNDRGKVYLCNVARRLSQGNALSCFSIWHSLWKNGEAIPAQSDSQTIRWRKSKEEKPSRQTDTPCSQISLDTPLSQVSMESLLSTDSLESSTSFDYSYV